MMRILIHSFRSLNFTTSASHAPLLLRTSIESSCMKGAKGYSHVPAQEQSPGESISDPVVMSTVASNTKKRPHSTQESPSIAREKHRQHASSVSGSFSRARSAANRGVGSNWETSPSTDVRRKGKRKAHTELREQQSPRRRRLNLVEPFMTEEYIRANMDVPQDSDYPSAPRTLFSSRTILQSMRNLGSQVMSLKFDSVPLNGFGQPGARCTISGSIPDFEPFSAVGEAHTSRKAMINACMHFLAQLHISGVLKLLYPTIEHVNANTLKDEQDAKIDVYNYAARYGLIPKITVCTVRTPIRKRKNVLYQVTIELPEQGISVVAKAAYIDTAEIAASLKFKAKAEEFATQHEQESIIIKDDTCLNTTNIVDFFKLYKFMNRDAILDVSDSLVYNMSTSNGSKQHERQVMLNHEPIGEKVTMKSKKKAEELAYLTSAVALTKDNPSLLEEFRRLTSSPGRGLLLPLKPLDITVDHDAILVMQETLRAARVAGLQDTKSNIAPNEIDKSFYQRRKRPELSPYKLKMRNASLKARYDLFQKDKELHELRLKRAGLPMSQYREKVLSHVEGHRYSVIVGATGSGKTTQLPQILLDNAIVEGRGAECNIICTQPRRIAATSVAIRVAEERNEKLQESVGYHVRFDPRHPRHGGSILYCTTGVLLQQIQHSPDEVLSTVSHIVIDEIHERDILVDFLLIILKKAIRERVRDGKSVPKIILMSATIDSELFAKYFTETTDEDSSAVCPSLSIPGRTFPVHERYLEDLLSDLNISYKGKGLSLLQDKSTKDYLEVEQRFVKTMSTDAQNGDSGSTVIDWKRKSSFRDASGSLVNEYEDALVPCGLAALTVAHIMKTISDGAVLVFLPGLDEIKKVDAFLRTQHPLGIKFSDESQFQLSMLHSQVPAVDQATVFKPSPPKCRKVILSTNIAETSVTIPDIQYVIDTGKLREKRYDSGRRITNLQCTWISQSNAKQRAGRAGRVQNGNYVALFSQTRYNSLRPIGLPEMLRSDLQEVCLDIKNMAFETPIRDFLADAIEPPAALAVDTSVKNLIDLQAITHTEQLTALGRVLGSLPVHPSLGKMIVLGIIFRCLDPMIILGALVNERTLFVQPIDSRAAAKKAQSQFLEGTKSDHVAQINAYRRLREISRTQGQHAAQQYAFANFLHFGAFRILESTTKAIESVLIESGLIPTINNNVRVDLQLGTEDLNRYSDNITLTKALALAGLHPNLGARAGSLYRTPTEKNVMMHPSSLNYDPKSGRNQRIEGFDLMSYSVLQKSTDGNSLSFRDVTASTPLMTLLFGGNLELLGNVITMDGWLPFYFKGNTVSRRLVMEYRKAMDRALTTAFERLTSNRAADSGDSIADDRVIDVFSSGLVDILRTDTASDSNVTRRFRDGGSCYRLP